MMDRPPASMLTCMDISVHMQPDAHPVNTGWIDDALAGAYAAGEPLGALVGRPLATGDGILLVGWPDGGPDRYHVIETHAGTSSGPATHMQIVEFAGPRTDEWVAAENRASTGRLWPATRNIAGVVSVVRLRAADNGYLVVILAEGMTAFEEATQAIMSTELLPDENPDLLGPPDSVTFYRLVHADLPLMEGVRT
jgi:hypothetical protein